MSFLKKVTVFYFSAFFAVSLQAGSFDSGSTGNDGALEACLESSTEVIEAPTGIKNYTTISIPSGCEVKFSVGVGNPPIRLLATGNVNIEGLIEVSATESYPGPGGFFGGKPGMKGFGPGGGKTLPELRLELGVGDDQFVESVGIFTPNLPAGEQNLIGGSGGGGDEYNSGGNGGGAILITSNTEIIINGNIGANGYYRDLGNGYSIGSGGMIHLIAPIISGAGGIHADRGRVILEGDSVSTNINVYSQNVSNSTGIQAPTLNRPGLTITITGDSESEEGIINLPASGETNVTFTASGVDDGSLIKLILINDNTQQTLSDVTLNNGTASTNINFPPGLSNLIAYIESKVEQSASLKFQGEPITHARIVASLGTNSEVRLFTKSGKRVPKEAVQNAENYLNFKKK